MKWSLYRSKLKRALRHRNLFVRLAFYELGLIVGLILALIYAFVQERTIIIPPETKQAFWTSRTHISDAYLAEMTNFFVSLRFNLSPANVEMQRDILLRYTEPRHYTAMKQLLTEEAERLKKQNLTMAFYPVAVSVNAKKLQAQVRGDLISSVGQNPLPLQRVTYRLTYRYQQGYLWIQQFEEIKPNAN